MKIVKNNKYLKNLFWLGPILSIMGLTAWIVSDKWSPIALGLLITGIAIIGLWVIFLGSLAPDFWRRRSTQVGTNAIIATVAMLVILGLINFLGVRYAQRIDLTENKQFSLSPLSQKIVENLQQPMKVVIFDSKPHPEDRELLKNYRRYGSNLQFEFIDPQLRPDQARRFNIKSAGEVYLEYGQERKLVQTVNDGERLSEIKLTNSIEQLTSDRTDKVYFLQGHGERPLEQVEGGLSQAVTTLKDKNFIAQPLNLAERAEVPKDASLVVVAGPKRPLFEGEVQALKNYLATGGSLLLMIDPETNPGLDSLLANWGVKLENQIVIDASAQERSVNLGPATPIVTNYGNHPITRDFGDGFSVYPGARPVDVKPVDGVQKTPLLMTSNKSWAESHPEKQPLQFDRTEDRPGPLMLGVALSRKAQAPLASPTPTPGTSPTASPKAQATATPGASPTASPKAQPTASPTATPQATATPGASPTASPQAQPTASPTPKLQATATPETSPTASPTGQPTASPTPTPQATTTPGASPTASPTGQPTTLPSLANQEKTDKKTSESRLVVFGNSNFATNELFVQPSVLNSDILMNSVSWLSKRDDQALSIRPKEQKNRRINLTSALAGILGWTALCIVPLIGFTTAGVIWWRRR
ncbi:MAG TPA: ABC transporter [Cyanobacteria bacterium UBA8543]|nr:ABC transporter [Cyanobacteria bacterium UBA8543]